MECSPRRLFPDHSRTAPTGRGVAKGRAQRVSRSPETVSWLCAASSSGPIAPATEDESRHSSRDGPVHCGQARESVGGDGRRPRSCRGGSEDRVDQSQVNVEATTIGRRDRTMPQVHRQSRERRVKELDAQRSEECALLERLVHAQSRVPSEVHPSDPGEQVTTLQQMVNMLQSERDALAKELHEARCGADDQDIRPVAKKQAVARQAGSRRDPRCPIPMMPRYGPNDVTNWLQDRQAEQHEALLQGDLQHVSDFGRVMAEGVTHSHRDHESAAFMSCQHDHVVNPVTHQCGFVGCRVGEASNPGPVQTRQARRLETALDGARQPGPTSRRRRRRALPWSWESDTELDTDPGRGAVG